MENKDFIEDIKAKLKAAEEVPYREGAWEKFHSQQYGGEKSNVTSFKRYASIAAAVIAVVGVSLYLVTEQKSTSESTDYIANIDSKSINENPIKNIDEVNIIENKSIDNQLAKRNLSKNNSISTLGNSSIEREQLELASVDIANLEINRESVSILNTIQSALASAKPFIQTDLITPKNVKKLPTVEMLAHQTVNEKFAKSEADLQRDKKMSLGSKFQLGLYVSPSRTSENFNVGGGLMLTYALTNKLKLRTGTAYNSYTVGVVKDPSQTASTEMINMEQAYSSSNIAVSDKSIVRQEMILPNINAVMGKVDALEIPLEISYDLNKGFYTSAGVSYSAIINQQREAQYIDNVSLFALQDNPSLIPNALEKMNKVETKTVVSNQDNVNTNGFNGFANFSIGKKVDINKKMSMSLEPFVKVPLGQYRKSDLNYTNSGIRIITTF